MDYYRPNAAGGIVQPNNIDPTNNNLLNMASDSYASDFWNIPYSDGLSPMKQIEGNPAPLFVTLRTFSHGFPCRFSKQNFLKNPIDQFY